MSIGRRLSDGHDSRSHDTRLWPNSAELRPDCIGAYAAAAAAVAALCSALDVVVVAVVGSGSNVTAAAAGSGVGDAAVVPLRLLPRLQQPPLRWLVAYALGLIGSVVVVGFVANFVGVVIVVGDAGAA